MIVQVRSEEGVEAMSGAKGDNKSDPFGFRCFLPGTRTSITTFLHGGVLNLP